MDAETGTNHVTLARRGGFMTEGGETGAEFKAKLAREAKQEGDSGDGDDI